MGLTQETGTPKKVAFWLVTSKNMNYNCSGAPVFKSENIGYQFNQKLLHHYQHSNNSIHRFILKIHQILGSHELKKRLQQFLTMLIQKSLSQLFDFLNLYQHANKICYSICSFLRYSQSYNPVTRLAAPIFDIAHLKTFWWSFKFCELVPACKKSVNSMC